MQNEHIAILKKIYANFKSGAWDDILSVCSEKFIVQIPGNSVIAGKYDRSSIKTTLVGRVAEASSGSHMLEVHDILASDVHAVALTSSTLTKNGTKMEYRTAHVWRFEGGRPVAWYIYPRDLYQYDACWGLAEKVEPRRV